MRALVFDNTLQYKTDYPAPRINENDALIRVTYAGICNTDLEITKGYMGFQGVLGHEFAGVIEECNNKEVIGKRVLLHLRYWNRLIFYPLKVILKIT